MTKTPQEQIEQLEKDNKTSLALVALVEDYEARLTRQFLEHKAEMEVMTGTNEWLRSQLDTANTRLDTAIKALEKFGQHTSECATMWDDDDYEPSEECDCGLAYTILGLKGK